MARTKRNCNVVIEDNSINHCLCPTAIYARLSAENSRKSNDKEVIKSQLTSCKQFINNEKNLKLVKEYVDNGFSGTKFDRPKFNELIDDIKSGKIKCVVVRDLSRFGRDYIETGTYLERIFPSLNVRFISVNEMYDSECDDKSNEALMIPLQNMINSLYAKDISRKVSTSHKTRILSGDFKKNMIPYGYKLDETRYKILIDNDTSQFVKLIYDMKVKGNTIKEIINELEKLNAPNPHIQKASTGVRKGDIEKYGGWHYSTIQNILSNHSYLGHTIYGRTEIALYRGLTKKTYTDKSKWITLENTHEPIIDVETFNKVKELKTITSKKRKERMLLTEKKRSKLINYYQGKIFCYDCKKPMSFIRSVSKNNFNASYKCSIKARGLGCSLHTINHNKLNDIILNSIKMQVQVAIDYELLLKKLKLTNSYKEIRTRQLNIINEIKLEIKELNNKRVKLYEDYSNGVLSLEEYNFIKETYDNQYLDKKDKYDSIMLQQVSFNESLSCDNQWIRLMKSVSKMKKISQTLIDNVIENIYIHDDGTVDITMRYEDVYKLMKISIQKIKEV